jgi:hypothetical protein
MKYNNSSETRASPAVRRKASARVRTEWWTGARRCSSATNPDRDVRRDVSCAQICVKFGSAWMQAESSGGCNQQHMATHVPKQSTCWIFCGYALRACGMGVDCLARVPHPEDTVRTPSVPRHPLGGPNRDTNFVRASTQTDQNRSFASPVCVDPLKLP